MKKTENYNQVSPKMLEGAKLKRGESVSYRVVSIQRNPANPAEVLIPAAINVPPVDQVWDEEKQDYVDIAAIKRISKDGNHLYHDIWFYGSQGGHINLRGGVAEDQEIHEYLSISNYNASNPNRDTSKEAIFELVDDVRRTDAERKLRNAKRDAMNAAADLDVEEVKDFIAAIGKDETLPIGILRNEVELFAETDPVTFMETLGNKDIAVKATLNRAIKSSAVLFDSEQSRFTWPNGEVILTVPRKTGNAHIEDFAAFCTTSAKGEKVLQTIQSKLKGPKAPQAAKKATANP